jgi:hypothetical protein
MLVFYSGSMLIEEAMQTINSFFAEHYIVGQFVAQIGLIAVAAIIFAVWKLTDIKNPHVQMVALTVAILIGVVALAIHLWVLTISQYHASLAFMRSAVATTIDTATLFMTGKGGLSAFLSALTALAIICSLMFRLKKTRPRFYGTIELLVASTLLWVALGQQTESLAKTLALASGAYVFIRGLDNIDKGMNSETELGKIWAALFSAIPKRAASESTVDKIAG